MSFLTVQDVTQACTVVASCASQVAPHIPGIAYQVFRNYGLYSIYESAFANILCLKTFRHGTDPYAFVRIHFEGNDPDRGGTGGEARWFETALQTTSIYAERDRGHFYVVEDVIGSEYTYAKKSFLDFAYYYYNSKRTLKYYAMRSNLSFYGSLLPLPGCIKGPLTLGLMQGIETHIQSYLIFGGLCPSVKFHLNPAKVRISGFLDANTPTFQRDGHDSDDGQAFEGALRTKYLFSVFDMGMLGVIKNGVNSSMAQRMRDNPGQHLLGLVQLVAAVCLTLYFFPGILPESVVYPFMFTAQLIEDSASYGIIATKIGEIASTIFYGPVGIALIMASFET